MSLKNDVQNLRKVEIPKGWKTVYQFMEEEELAYDTCRKMLAQLVKAGQYESRKFPGHQQKFFRKKK